MIYSRFAVLVIALGLGACASTSPKYVPAANAEDHGYYSTRLGENRYRVVYNGNVRTGLNTTRGYALLRAAELTVQEGYDWFQIVDRETATSYSERPGSGVSYEQTRHEETSCGLLGCTRRTHPHSRAGMEVNTGGTDTKYSHALEIVMGKGETPEEGGNYYEARSLSRSLLEAM
jgi:hypothetical protein